MIESDPLLRARIDTQSLRHNLATIRRAAPAARVMAVIKANAYGHGLVPVARALTAADAFAVARIEEAAELRAATVAHDIVLLEGVSSPQQLREALNLRLQMVVHDISQVEMLEAQVPGQALTLWIKVNTGMNRLGFAPVNIPGIWRRLQALRSVPVVHLMTHLAVADEPEHPLTNQQLAQFAQARDGIRVGAASAAETPTTSIGNSAGVFSHRACHGDWVRPGIALYGISPFAGRSAASLDLRPVMSLETSVIALHELSVGESVGYGGTWRATRRTRIAVLAAGYADGVPRHLANGAPVSVSGVRASVAGRVSMDMMTVDVTNLVDVQIGSPVILWGAGLPAEEVAHAAGTIAYELLSRLGRRVPLQYF